jgi:hypothetical protein
MRINTSRNCLLSVIALAVALLGIFDQSAVSAGASIQVIQVDDDAALGGNGSARSPFNNLGTLAAAWIDHPESDPFLGPCPGDGVNEPLNNVLRYNGVHLANGRNF